VELTNSNKTEQLSLKNWTVKLPQNTERLHSVEYSITILETFSERTNSQPHAKTETEISESSPSACKSDLPRNLQQMELCTTGTLLPRTKSRRNQIY